MTSFVLHNARIWRGDGSAFEGHLVVADGVIQSVTEGAPAAESIGSLPLIDLQGLALSPGLIDLMVLGGFDKSILRDDPLDIARQYLRLGVTACQLCIGTLPWASMVQVAENARHARAASQGVVTGCDSAEVLGLYLEGPFQDPRLTGASLSEHALPPSADNVARLLDELGDVVTQINVAPGTPGDADAIRALRAAGMVVSMAHSDAIAERVMTCLEAGTTVLGHVWDNNSGLIGDSGVQQPTIEHVALTDERVRFIHLIGDGVHVHPVLVRLVLRCRGIESLCVVTDAVPRAGCPDGSYVWDDGRHFYKEGGVGRTDRHTLTGSALLLPDMLRNLIKFTGLPPEQAIRAVTFNPAASLGLDGRMGLLAPGRQADLVAWDESMQVGRVWRRGREVENLSGLGEVHLS